MIGLHVIPERYNLFAWYWQLRLTGFTADVRISAGADGAPLNLIE
jgi:hypothetical protein